ncbi:MAG: hypothetical protein OSB69_21340, partial [Alphaproteobacteria bacterium]|nr:hypothetical protein [Alphaproteobacteria bacterium]
MAKLSIMLVEDNPDDELLTLRELRKQNIANEIIVMRDGAEALDYLYAQGTGKVIAFDQSNGRGQSIIGFALSVGRRVGRSAGRSAGRRT